MWDFLRQYGPTILVLIMAIYRDEANSARHKQALAELEKKFTENKSAVKEENSGLSDDAIIDKYTKGPRAGA